MSFLIPLKEKILILIVQPLEGIIKFFGVKDAPGWREEHLDIAPKDNLGRVYYLISKDHTFVQVSIKKNQRIDIKRLKKLGRSRRAIK